MEFYRGLTDVKLLDSDTGQFTVRDEHRIKASLS